MQFTSVGQRQSRLHLLMAISLLAMSLPAGRAAAQATFSDVSDAAGIGAQTESYGASWGDINGDRYPDLFLNNHRLQPSMYLNLGDGTFYETSNEVRTWVNRPNADQHGGSFADFDNDGDQDLLISLGTGNPSQFFVNDFGALLDKTDELGVAFENVGGRMPVWLDYNDDGLLDFVMTQFGGAAKVFRQTSGGFVETSAAAGVLCLRFQFGLLLDTMGDGRLDFVCPDDASFPQKIYDTSTFPWTDITSVFPQVPQVADAVIADFDNDQRMDMFLISNVQLRPSGVSLVDPFTIEASLSGGEKGFNFVSNGSITVDLDWNKLEDGFGLPKIRIGANQISPFQVPFTLNPADPNIQGMAPPDAAAAPVMRLGYDNAQKRWTFISQTENIFSESYFVVTTTGAVSNLNSTGLWPSDQGGAPTLIMHEAAGFTDRTASAGLGAVVQCSSATTGDFDNDMDVDLYLACSTATRNLENLYFDNDGNGVFTLVSGAGGAPGPVGNNVSSGAGTADSVVAADYDLDGFLDLAITNGFGLRPKDIGGPNRLYRNAGNGNHWIQLDLVGTSGTRDPVGARVTATANGVSQLRVYNGSYHRWSQGPTRMHFGLASAGIVDLSVRWPDGNVENFPGVAADALYEITEGSSIQAVLPGNANPYPCGAPNYEASVDAGAFVWRDCRNDIWKIRFASGGPSTIFNGRVVSAAGFDDVMPFSVEPSDVVDHASDPSQAAFEFIVGGVGQDGMDLDLLPDTSACLQIDAPQATPVYYGPFGVQLQQPVDLLTGGTCAVSATQVNVSDTSADESAAAMQFVLSLTAPSSSTVTLSVSTSDGTASAGSDYTAIAPQTVTFLPGQTQKTVSVPLLDDSVGEGNETFVLNLANPSGAVLGRVSATATIIDNEASACGTPVFDAAVDAGVFLWKDCGSNNWHARMTSGGSPTIVIYDGSIVANQAFAAVSPYSIEGSDVVDSASDPLQVSYSLRMLNSGVDGIDFSPAAASSSCFDLDAPAAANVYVGQNRTLLQPPFDLTTLGACGGLLPSVSVSAESANEGDGQLNATVTLSAAATSNVTVSVQTANGTALAGSDYVAVPPTQLVFLPGQTSKSLAITLLDDTLAEGSETFNIALSNVSNATIGSASASATIFDNELSPCGEPAVDAASEKGVYLWKNCVSGAWNLRVTGGGAFEQYDGTLVTTLAFSSVAGFSIEASDVLDIASDPLQARFELKVSGSGRDGIDFVPAPLAATCLSVESPALPAVFVGVTKTPVAQPFDIDTLDDCADLPPTVSVAASSVDESAGTANVSISLSQASSQLITVDISTADGSALAGEDFIALPATRVEFAPGQTVAGIDVIVLNDAVAEGDETIVLALSGAAGASLGQPTATLTIVDDEPSPCGEPAFDPATEAGVFIWKDCTAGDWHLRVSGGGSFRTYNGSLLSSAAFASIAGFSIDPADTFDIVSDPAAASFNLQVSGGGTDGIDFRPAAGALTCVTANLPSGASLYVGSGRQVLASPFDLHTLGACGAQPLIGLLNVSVIEGDVALLNVFLSQPSADTVSVDYATGNGSAVTPGDYLGDNGRLTIPAGMMNATVGIATVDDALIEPLETFSVTLSDPQAAALGTSQATATIVDNDAAGLSIDSVSAAENSPGIAFTVSLSAASVVPVTVQYTTANGVAIAGQDYVAQGPTLLTFDPGQTVKIVTVPLNDDALVEGDEHFTVTLSNASGAQIATGTGTGTILDNEPQPQLSIGDAQASEGAPSLSFTATLNVASTQAVSFDYATGGGTAQAGQDYVAVTAGTLQFAPGQTSASFDIVLIDDAQIEGDETVGVAISNVSRATLLTPLVTGTLLDDESTATLSIADVTASEASGFLTFTAVLSAPSSVPASVAYATADGSATAGADYTAVSGTLNFPAGVVSRTVQVPLIDDNDVEFDETFALQLSNPVQLALATPVATATVKDDEAVVCGAPSFDPASEAVVAVWQDCTTGAWRLRMTAGGGFRSYAGNVYSNQGFASVTGVSVEAGDTLNFSTDPTKIVFTLGMSAPGFDGIDFVASPDAELCLSVSVPPGTALIAGADRTPVPQGVFDPRTLDACDVLPELSVDDIAVNEADGTATFDVALSAVSALPVAVDYRTVDGTAVAGADYVALPLQTLVFAPGEVQKQVQVTLLDDIAVEVPEAFSLYLDHAVNAAFGVAQLARSATATINDNEIATAVTIGDQQYGETDGNVSVLLELTAAAGTPVSVDVQIAAGSATPGVDYAAVSVSTVTFQAGQTARSLPLTIFDDALAEGGETIAVNLSNAQGAPIANAGATLTIEDDEPSPCGMPVVDPASDTGVFLWKNCATGSWNVQMTAASGFRIYSGVVAAEQPFLSVSPVSIEANDVLDFTSNPSSIDFELRIGAGFDDGFTFETVSGAALCFAVNAPTDAAVYFGGDAVELAAPFRLDDLGLCDANNP